MAQGVLRGQHETIITHDGLNVQLPLEDIVGAVDDERPTLEWSILNGVPVERSQFHSEPGFGALLDIHQMALEHALARRRERRFARLDLVL